MEGIVAEKSSDKTNFVMNKLLAFGVLHFILEIDE